jgi:hypothetical protein
MGVWVSGLKACTVIVICSPGFMALGLMSTLSRNCPAVVGTVAVPVTPVMGTGVLVFDAVALGVRVLVR